MNMHTRFHSRRAGGIKPDRRHPKSGFTLTELLIVVAILSMLAAIAVPNLLEAQTRSKVSRSKVELRTLATGLEVYRTDHAGYPVVGSLTMPGSWDMSVPYRKRLLPLTTPVAYVMDIPHDIFAPEADTAGLGPEYCYAPGNFYHGASPRYSGKIYRNTIYSLAGRGPDREINTGGYCLSHPAAHHNQMSIRGAYDPTNGTVSAGDIIQLSCGRL